jgi:hypothetical protein
MRLAKHNGSYIPPSFNVKDSAFCQLSMVKGKLLPITCHEGPEGE